MIIRVASASDIPQLVELRLRLLTEVGAIQNSVDVKEWRIATAKYFESGIETGHTTSWVAIVEESAVGCGALVEFRRPPHFDNLPGKEAYLLNMYTLPSFRRNGIANQIFEQIMDFAAAQGYGKVWLHATDEGRPLYERYGFQPNRTALEWLPKSR